VAHGTLIAGKLGVSAKAADSDLLDGYHYDAFSFAGHNHNDWYLGKTAKAADSDLLDGYHYDAFSFAGHTHTSLTLSSLTFGSTGLSLLSKRFMTDASLTVKSTGGTVTSVDLNEWKEYIYYLGYTV
jgi:hypothetical protein